jgi:hypothetical protein
MKKRRKNIAYENKVVLIAALFFNPDTDGIGD